MIAHAWKDSNIFQPIHAENRGDSIPGSPGCWFQGCGLCSAHQRPAEGSTAAGGGGLCRDEIQAIRGEVSWGKGWWPGTFKKKTDGNVMAGIWDFVLQHSVFFKVLLFFFHGRWQLVWMLESTRCILLAFQVIHLMRTDPFSTNSLMLESVLYRFYRYCITTTTISRPSWAMARPESATDPGTEAAEHLASCAGSAEVEPVARMDPERRWDHWGCDGS